MGHERLLGVLGVAGLAFGLLVTIAGRFGGELGGPMSGYGSLVIASAVYLLIGLGVRRQVARRHTSPSSTVIATEPRA